MKHTILFATPLLLAALLPAGCQNTVNTVENTEKSAAVNNINDTRVITDRFLRDRLALRSVHTGRTAAGLLRVEVTAVNARTSAASQLWSWMTDENPYPVDYRFTWQDAQGMTVETPLSIWRTVTLYPGEIVNFQSVAPTPECQDFVLEIKETN